MPSRQGKFVWYELMTTDIKAASAFYAEVVGWKAADASHVGMPYIMMAAGEAQVAGLMILPEEARAQGARPLWIGYVSVQDVDASAARAKAAGGQIYTGPRDIPGVGRFCMIADPQGAAISLFKGAGEMTPPEGLTNAPGQVGWNELMAVDGPAAFDFYVDLFGWTKTGEVDMGAMGPYITFANGGDPIGGVMTKPPAMPRPVWNYYFNVDSIKAAVGRLEGAGGKVTNGPQQVPGGDWIVQATDPQGAGFCLFSPNP